MRFTIVIPCYNYAHVVERAVRSVFEQDESDFEVVAIDDGSTDESRDVLDRCARAQGTRLRVLHQANRGLSAVRNRGAREAVGSYLIFLDADDELMPGALAHLRRAIADGAEPPLVIGGYLAVHPSGRQRVHRQPPLSELREQRFLRYLRGETRIMNGAAAVRRDVVLETPFEEAVRAGEDVPFFASLLAWHDCLTIDRPLIKLHKHPDSLRHDVTAMEHARPRMPALLFDHGRLPPELARHRPEFAARCALAQSHTYARAGRHRSALTSFGRAVALSPRVALRARPLRELARVLRRFVRSAGADG